MTELNESAHPADEFDTGDDLDLTPRRVEVCERSKRRWLPMLAIVGVVAALGFILLRTLGDAALFFYNADEAIEQRTELVDQRFRVQGTPFGETFEIEVERNGRIEPAVVFPINFEGSIVDVVHVGSPAELFQPGVPVVLEGQWQQGFPDGVDGIDGGANDGWVFSSNDMIVKHDNEYRNSERERIAEAEQGGIAQP